MPCCILVLLLDLEEERKECERRDRECQIWMAIRTVEATTERLTTRAQRGMKWVAPQPLTDFGFEAGPRVLCVSEQPEFVSHGLLLAALPRVCLATHPGWLFNASVFECGSLCPRNPFIGGLLAPCVSASQPPVMAEFQCQPVSCCLLVGSLLFLLFPLLLVLQLLLTCLLFFFFFHWESFSPFPPLIRATPPAPTAAARGAQLVMRKRWVANENLYRIKTLAKVGKDEENALESFENSAHQVAWWAWRCCSSDAVTADALSNKGIYLFASSR